MAWTWTGIAEAETREQSVELALAELGLGKVWADAGLKSDIEQIGTDELLKGPLLGTVLKTPNCKLVEMEGVRAGRCPVENCSRRCCLCAEAVAFSVSAEEGVGSLSPCWNLLVSVHHEHASGEVDEGGRRSD